MNNDELSGKSNELLSVPQISSRDKYIPAEYVGAVCDSEDGCVGGGKVSFLSELTCSLRLNLDYSVREVTVREFKVGDVYMLSDLKELAHSFGLKSNFVPSRCGKRISCNYVSRYGSYITKCVLRKSSSITCSYS